MNELLKHLSSLMGNQFVGGGLLLMASGSLIALARNLPANLWARIKGQSMISLTVADSDPLFDWISIWLSVHPYTKKARSLWAQTKEDYDDIEERWTPRIIFSPSRGEHFFFYQGKFIWLSRQKDEKAVAVTKPNEETGATKTFLGEHYTFTTLGRTQSVIRALIDDVISVTQQEREEKIGIYTSAGYGGWSKMGNAKPRSLDSVLMVDGQKEDLIADIEQFLSEEAWYSKRGVPYRRGYLFYGPPGNGKTSSIMALAGALKLNLYSLNLSDKGMGDGDLAKLVRSIRGHSILLLEDVDAALHARQEVDEKTGESKHRRPKDMSGVTLSGILNVLDGVMTPAGLLVMMTSNYPQDLDEALVRPGRIDKRLEFANASMGQKLASYRWFYPERGEAAAVRFAESLPEDISMATVQEALIALKDDKKEALAMVAESSIMQEQEQAKEITAVKTLVGMQNEIW